MKTKLDLEVTMAKKRKDYTEQLNRIMNQGYPDQRKETIELFQKELFMDVKIKKLHENAVIPKYAKPGDAGLDLTATSKSYDDKDSVVYGTGLAVEIPEGYVGLLFPRSSLTNYALILGNHVGVIDSGYRGELIFKFKQTYTSIFKDKVYDVGDRIGQLLIIPYPKINLVEVQELSQTERGTGGYGSTNKEETKKG